MVLPCAALVEGGAVVEAVYPGRSGKLTMSAAAAVAWAVGSALGITILGGAVEDCGAADGEAGPDTDPAS